MEEKIKTTKEEEDVYLKKFNNLKYRLILEQVYLMRKGVRDFATCYYDEESLNYIEEEEEEINRNGIYFHEYLGEHHTLVLYKYDWQLRLYKYLIYNIGKIDQKIIDAALGLLYGYSHSEINKFIKQSNLVDGLKREP